MGAPASVETNLYVTSWNPISSRAGSPGGFTFPSSTQSGASLEAPSTPKAFPTAAANNGGPAFKFSSDPIAGKLVFSLPSGVVESAEDSDPFNRKNFKFDSRPDLVFRYDPFTGFVLHFCRSPTALFPYCGDSWEMFITMHRLIFTVLFFQYWHLLMKLFVNLISVLQLPPLHQHLDHLQFRNHQWIQLNQLRSQPRVTICQQLDSWLLIPSSHVPL